MDIKSKIGLRIKEIRKEKGLTQEALAWQSELDRTFMNHVENGKRNISIETLEKIVYNGLQTTLQDFFDAAIFNGKKKIKK